MLKFSKIRGRCLNNRHLPLFFSNVLHITKAVYDAFGLQLVYNFSDAILEFNDEERGIVKLKNPWKNVIES